MKNQGTEPNRIELISQFDQIWFGSYKWNTKECIGATKENIKEKQRRLQVLQESSKHSLYRLSPLVIRKTIRRNHKSNNFIFCLLLKPYLLISLYFFK